MRIYGVLLSFNNGTEKLQLPLNPKEISVRESGKNATHDVSGLGEINVIKNRSLTEYSFESLFPAQRYPFLSIFDGLNEKEIQEVKMPMPVECIKLIEKWMVTKKPIRFIFTSDTYTINTPASIESFEWSEVAGSSGDVEFSLTLKKYVFYAARKIEQTINAGGVVTQKASTPARPNDKQSSKTYKMVAGDSLWLVAKKELGNGNRWNEIQKLNNISDAELTRLQIGRVLKLP